MSFTKAGFSILFQLGVGLLTLSGCNTTDTAFPDNYAASVKISYVDSVIKTSATSVFSGSVASVKLILVDTHFNPFVVSNATVTFQASGGTSVGTFGTVVNNEDGSYSASFTGVTAGSATSIHAFVNGNEIQSTPPGMTVTSGSYSLSQSTIGISSNTVSVGSAVTATVTVRDTQGNQATGGYNVVFSHSGGTSDGNFSATTDHGDGTYSATFTGVASGTSIHIGASIQGNSIASTEPQVTVIDIAPTTLVYSGNPAVYTLGQTITANAPSNLGGPLSNYSVNPALPAGLSLNSTTGVISGTPTALASAGFYTVTGTNSGGTTSVSLELTVNDVAPSAFSYATSPAVYTKGTAIADNAPASSGGAVISYSVSPSLPTGLSLDAGTGVISGTPSVVSSAATYTVTAMNSGGNTTASVSITVNDIIPSALTYSANPVTYTNGFAITNNTATHSGGAILSYTVSPPLPAGLSLSVMTGTISGTPTAVVAAATYTITGTNSGGDATATVSIAVGSPTITVLSGALQNGTAGSTLGSPLIAVVKDANATAISGVTVAWAVSAGGGATSSCTTSTNGSGQVQCSFSLGTVVGTNTITATASGSAFTSPATFTETGAAGPAATIAVSSGSGQTGTAGVPLPGTLVAVVTDANSNVVSGASVTWAVSAGGGSISSCTASTNSMGLVHCAFTTGTSAGTNTVTATVAGVSTPATFTEIGNAAAPTLTSVIATVSANPTEPAPTQMDYTIGAGGNVFVQWNVSAAPNGLGSTPISITYVTNSASGNVASNLANGANGCTPDAYHSGCYLWTGGSPSTSYFAVRVIVTDSAGLASAATSPGLNTWPPINFLAGNTDPGTGGAGTSAVFVGSTAYNSESDAGSLAVAENGTVYFRDITRGIITVSATTGVQSILVPLNASNSSSYGDGGPISAATVKVPFKITLDFSGNLLIWDYDRIRKVNTSANPMTITTLIGGGASFADGVAPTSVKITPPSTSFITDAKHQYGPFFTLPNGNIYFQSEVASAVPATSASGTGFRVRIYNPTSGLVQSIYITGTGDSCNSAQALSTQNLDGFGIVFDSSSTVLFGLTSDSGWCTVGLNPSTWAASKNLITGTTVANASGSSTTALPAIFTVGHDGNIYAYNYVHTDIYKYNNTTNSWSLLIGNGTNGLCASGNVASSCAANPNDVYVTAAGQVYYIDRGIIRTLDPNGKIINVMGQGFNYGDGGNALSARFSVVNSIGLWNSGSGDTITVLDQNELLFREFKIGGNIATIAGTGSSGSNPFSSTTLATSVAIEDINNSAYTDDFQSDAGTGDVYLGIQGYLEHLIRSTGKWAILAGGGTNPETTADGDVGTTVTYSVGTVFAPRVLGWDGTNVLTNTQARNGGSGYNQNPMFKLNNATTGYQYALAGVINNVSDGYTFSTGTIAATSCVVPDSQSPQAMHASHDAYATPSQWVTGVAGTKSLKAIQENFPGYVNTANAYDFATLTVAANAIAYRHDATHNIVYYCGTDGILHKHDITAASDTAYAWPVTSIQCTGRSLIYDANRGSLIFPYIQNGLYGVAEYTSP